MDKYLLKAAVATNAAISPDTDDLEALGLIWQPGNDVDVYKNVIKGGNVAFNFGVRMIESETMIAETQLRFYRRNRVGRPSFALVSDKESLKRVVAMPEFSHLNTKPVLALVDIVESFNSEEFKVQKDKGGFTLKI